MDSTRKLRRELGYEIAKLHGLQQSVDLTRDDASAKALAAQIRGQAGTCLSLLDRYQSSVPGRMWSDAERNCQPLREELKRTERQFRSDAGEWEGRTLTRSYLRSICEWTWDDFYGPVDELGAAEAPPGDEQTEGETTLPATPSRGDIGAYYLQSFDGLIARDDDVAPGGGTATGLLRFTLPTAGESPEQTMVVLVRDETGLVYEHQYGGSCRRHVEIEGFLVPAWAHPEAKDALDQLFVVDLGGNGVPDEGRSEAVATVGAALGRIWYRGTADRMAPLQMDEERADELDQAWVPVRTPDGPGYLAWVNSD